MCVNPVHTKFGDFGCGHCLQCLKQYQDMWTARLSEESKSWKPVNGVLPIVFFTLKYRDDSIPCRYLVATKFGYYFTSSRPDCEVYPFWTTFKELKSASISWKSRKATYLEKWRNWYNSTSRELNEGRRLDISCDGDRRLIKEGRFEVVGSSLSFSGRRAVLAQDMPVSFGFEDFEVPCISEGVAAPLFAFEFHTVEKSHVQDWFKRCRIRLTRSIPEVFAKDYNVRFSPDWIDVEGNVHRLPSCAVPKTLKYFITSEYGPTTQRPHLHGALYGVTYDEFKEYFAKDWEEHFGSIDFSAYDSARGAFSYIAKYCSKGGYEHPYCSKDFFYPSGLEYHSTSFEMCLKDFNIDKPIVNPTFHLVSNGIGVSYAFRNEVLNYFGVNLREYLTESGRRRYVAYDSVALPSPSLDIMDATFARYSQSIKFIPCDNGTLIRKYYRRVSKTGAETMHLVGESFLSDSAIVDYLKESETLSKKYNRIYVKSIHQPCCPSSGVRERLHPAWHLVGHKVCGYETRQTSIALPRYYRQWLLSPLASALRTSASRRLYSSTFERIAGIFQSERPCNEKVALVEQIEGDDLLQRTLTSQRLRRVAENFYCKKSGVKDID